MIIQFLIYLLGIVLGRFDKIDAQLEGIMSVMTEISEFAAAVDAATNKMAEDITAVAAQIEALKAQLVDAATPAEVDAALNDVLAKLNTTAASLTALAAGGTPEVPPEEPPL